MKYKFKPIIIKDKELQELFDQVKEFFLSDYDDEKTFLDELLNECMGHFYKVYNEKNEFIGCIFLNDWQGYYHSCEFNAFAKRGYSKYTIPAGKEFLKNIFEQYKLTKVKTTVDIENKAAIYALKKTGFKEEALLKQEIKRQNRLIDRYIYSIFSSDIL